MRMKRPVRKHLSIENLKLIGIPKHMWDISEEDFNTYSDDGLLSVKNYVLNYLDNIDENFEQNNGIFFCGSNGVGKTMLACLIAKEAYRHRYTSSRVTLADYVKKYTAMWGAKDPGEKEALEIEFFNRYKAVEFLILEELGKELDTKAVRPILEDLLRYREDENLVTIYCTNLSPRQLKEIYGNSIYSLIRGHAYNIKIDNVDRRGE